jgi:ketosteroid isomerase-like protein
MKSPMIMNPLRIAFAACMLAVLGVAAPQSHPQSRIISEVDAVLNDLHDAASKANFDRYFSHFTEDAVFLGTDPSERWNIPEFRAYTKARFERGNGWHYVPKERHVFLSKDWKTAWFDEMMESKKYGHMRGTGVLVKSEETWQVAQYNLSKPIPNQLFRQIVDMIEPATPAAK